MIHQFESFGTVAAESIFQANFVCGWPENLCIRVGNTGNSAYRMQINLSGPLNQNNKKKEWLYSPNIH